LKTKAFVIKIIFRLVLILLVLVARARSESAVKIFLVLGCNMGWLQQDRVSTALKHWNSVRKSDPLAQSIWYLSGGVKNAIEAQTQPLSEAEKMSSSLSSANLNIVLDTTATNTAENFRNFSRFVSTLGISNPEIIVVTSGFHKARAEKFFYGFFPQSLSPRWVLGTAECATCAQDELFHMRNVQADISKALGYDEILVPAF
jgi:uncharacterized SAM-binding protein YcdF (DUF218 family)